MQNKSVQFIWIFFSQKLKSLSLTCCFTAVIDVINENGK